MTAKNETVICATCGKEHEPMPGMAATQQAYECAATVRGDTVTGHYGSTVIDMEVWSFKQGRPENVREGNICDACISGLIESGTIELSERGVW